MFTEISFIVRNRCILPSTSIFLLILEILVLEVSVLRMAAKCIGIWNATKCETK